MKAEQKEKWWQRLKDIEVDVFTPKDIEELSMMLTTSVMTKALAIVLSQVPQHGAALLRLNLNSDEDLAQAKRLQSQSAGIVRAVELLGELALEDKEEEAG